MFGTSAPELLISIQAALDGVPGIAVGNVVGSNIANVLLVTGAAGVVYPLASGGGSARRDAAVMMAVSLGFGVMFATAVSLVIVPCIYLVLDDIKRALRWIYRPDPEPGSPGEQAAEPAQSAQPGPA